MLPLKTLPALFASRSPIKVEGLVPGPGLLPGDPSFACSMLGVPHRLRGGGGERIGWELCRGSEKAQRADMR